ncbi:MAG: putative Fe-S cluster assembly protein SufT [Rhodanobacteraceae bacterium]|nr:MAG: putative Fe-S cluster assembly protein SufT [Rhodanobacteraceae bacterium]
MGAKPSTRKTGRDEIVLQRDCAVVMVPQGDKVVLQAGQGGYVTQAVGGSFTIFVAGNLYRVTGEDADAIGKDAPEPLRLPDDANDRDVETLAWAQLRTCFDPEIPVNVVDLGLVYALALTHTDDGRRSVQVKLTLTAPGCGMGDVLVDDATSKLKLIPTIADVKIELVFDPPWNYSMMSAAAKLDTGML